MHASEKNLGYNVDLCFVRALSAFSISKTTFEYPKYFFKKIARCMHFKGFLALRAIALTQKGIMEPHKQF